MSVFKSEKQWQIGVISDTHGMLRTGVEEAFRGVDLILHAGDVGSAEVIKVLGKIAPVTAVRGNTDGGPFGQTLHITEAVEVAETFIYMLHDLNRLDMDPEAGGFQAVITGHTHQPCIDRKNGVLYLNPGSAGPRRFDYPVTVARITVRGNTLSPEIIRLEP